jgi:uncharacterized protein YcbX
MKIVGRIESLWRYPVKSMMGEQLPEAYLWGGGVFGDRRYGFLTSAAPADFPYFTARERHDMLLHRASYRHPDKMIRPNGGLSPDDGAIVVETPQGEQLAVDDPRLIELLRVGVRERHHITLIHSENAIVDSRPVSLFSLQTLKHLSRENGMELDKRRFRANIYVDLGAEGGFTEDDWVGRRLRMGSDAVVEISKRNQRCKLITLDPDSTEGTPEVMSRLARNHEMRAGIYATVVAQGMVSAGDEIRLLD